MPFLGLINIIHNLICDNYNHVDNIFKEYFKLWAHSKVVVLNKKAYLVNHESTQETSCVSILIQYLTASNTIKKVF